MIHGIWSMTEKLREIDASIPVLQSYCSALIPKHIIHLIIIHRLKHFAIKLKVERVLSNYGTAEESVLTMQLVVDM